MSGRWLLKLVYILQVLALYDVSKAQESPQAGSAVSPVSSEEETSISRRMCGEYAQQIPNAETLAILRNSNLFNSSVCDYIWSGSRIIGGVMAAPKEFPHMASIGYGGEMFKTWACGGSLISQRFVLTAAHCLNSGGLKGLGKARWVRIGGISLLTKESADRQEFSVEQRIYHPSYERPSQYHDIGLIRLDHDVVFSAFARPACLHTDTDIPVDTALATGWGVTEKGGRSDWLKKVSLSLAPMSLCNSTFNDINPDELARQLGDGLLNETMICAGHTSGGKDTCTGDSGGPLQFFLQEPHCMISVIGVTSFGRECGGRGTGAIYTRVSSYVSWIENIVWPKDNVNK